MIGELLALGLGGLAGAVPAGLVRPRAGLGLTLIGAAALLAAAATALDGGAEWEWRSSFAPGGEALYLRLDGVSALFLALVGVVGGAGAAYARGYWPEAERPGSARRGQAWWSLLLLCMALVLLCSNGLHFLIAWEAFALSGYFLITLERERRAVRAAGWLYLAASHAGTLALFAFFALLAARAGSWELSPLRDRADVAPLYWLCLFGFGMKAGLFPLHFWLPSAHAGAPSHVSALLSGVAIKMGLYGLVRFGGWLPLPPAAGWVVLALGAAGAVLGAAYSLAQNDLKRLLAYCSVEHVGVILIGLGTGMLGALHADAPWGRVALAGALLHVWNHGLFKALLFLAAGSAVHACGTREMGRMGGLWRALPWTASLFAFGALAVSALPPLNGFVSEWLIYLGLLESAAGPARVAAATLAAAIGLGVTGALSLAAFVKASAVVFLGSPRTQAAAQAHECGGWMRAPMLGLAGACAGLALAPALAWPLVASALGAWNPAWSGPDQPAPLRALAWAQLGVAALLLVATLALLARLRGGAARRGPSWDCGFAAPSARMQYSSGSFAALATGWFRWLSRPELRLRRPRGAFPLRAEHFERVPETVLERVLVPASGVVMSASGWVRRRQHGRLQHYALYLVVGLTCVAALVLSWSLR